MSVTFHIDGQSPDYDDQATYLNLAPASLQAPLISLSSKSQAITMESRSYENFAALRGKNGQNKRPSMRTVMQDLHEHVRFSIDESVGIRHQPLIFS